MRLPLCLKSAMLVVCTMAGFAVSPLTAADQPVASTPNSEPPSPVAESLDDYFDRWFSRQPPRPPDLSPYYLPYGQLQSHVHVSLITDPDDARTLSRAAEYLPGATLIDEGARGTLARLSVMGAAPEQNLWTVDGARASQPDGGFSLLSFAGYSGLRFAPDRYASVWHAIGRVLSLATPDPGPYNRFSIGGGAGAQGVLTQHASVNWNGSVVQGAAGEEIESRRENSHDNSVLQTNSEWLAVRIPVDTGHTILVRGQRLEMRRGWYESNNTGFGAPDDPNDEQHFRFENGTVESLWEPDPSLSFHLAFSGSQQFSVLDQVPDALSFTNQRDKTTLTRAGLRSQLCWQTPSTRELDVHFTASLIAEAESYKRPPKTIAEHGQTVLAALGFDFQARDEITFHVDVTAFSATGIDTVALPTVALTIPLFPRGKLLEERFELTLRGSRDLQAPSYEQRFLNDFTLVGNPDLKPVQTELWQAILQYECPFAQATAQYDYRHYLDEIVTDTSTAPFTFINRDGADVSALNVSLRTQPVDARFQALAVHLPFFFDWTYTQAEDASGAAALERPRHDIKLGQELGLFTARQAFRLPDFHPQVAGMAAPYFCRLGAQWHYRSGWKVPLGEPDLGAFYTLDGFISVTPRLASGSNIELRFDAQNLTNRKIPTDLGHSSEGLLWVGSLRVNWLL